MRRASSLHSVDELVAREISTKFTEVQVVAAHISDVVIVAGGLTAITTANAHAVDLSLIHI